MTVIGKITTLLKVSFGTAIAAYFIKLVKEMTPEQQKKYLQQLTLQLGTSKIINTLTYGSRKKKTIKKRVTKRKTSKRQLSKKKTENMSRKHTFKDRISSSIRSGLTEHLTLGNIVKIIRDVGLPLGTAAVLARAVYGLDDKDRTKALNTIITRATASSASTAAKDITRHGMDQLFPNLGKGRKTRSS